MVLDTGPREAVTNKTGAKVLATPGTRLDTAAASAADSERAVHDTVMAFSPRLTYRPSSFQRWKVAMGPG
jgi:hypothetical protein